MNPKNNTSVHFIQMWVPPDTEHLTPGYQQLDINGHLNKGVLVPIASGRGHEAAISIRQKGAVLWGGRLGSGETVIVPDAPYVHVFVAKGSARLEQASVLNTGDEARLTQAGARSLTAENNGAEVLIWETDRTAEQ